MFAVVAAAAAAVTLSLSVANPYVSMIFSIIHSKTCKCVVPLNLRSVNVEDQQWQFMSCKVLSFHKIFRYNVSSLCECEYRSLFLFRFVPFFDMNSVARNV